MSPSFTGHLPYSDELDERVQNSEHLQSGVIGMKRVTLVDQNGNPIPGLGGGSLTPASPTFATVGVTSASAVAANANRRGLVLVNTSANRISFGLGATAVLNRGITLTPFGIWVMETFEFTTGAINAIASAASSNLAIQEFT